jgi:hypothetical protein
MPRTKADQLEEALERMAQGKRIGGTGTAFVKTAQQLSALAAPPPPPPGQLTAGRQRLLAEAARMDTVKAARPRQPALRAGNFRLAGALLAAVLIMGLAFVGRAAADSLPGTPLYGLKLVVEQARMALTTDAEHSAACFGAGSRQAVAGCASPPGA